MIVRTAPQHGASTTQTVCPVCLQVAKTTMTALEGEVFASTDSPSNPAAFLDAGAAEASAAANGARS